MADVMTIIKGISQVMANSYDGARDDEGNRLKTGLKRDEEVDIQDQRVMDGFKIKLSGNMLRLTYHTEARMKDVHDNKFKDEIESTIKEVVSFIKKEFKKVTGDSLTLTEKGEPDIEMSHTSSVRNWVVASCLYEIGGIEVDGPDKNKKDLDSAVKDWLSLGKNAKKSKSDER